MFKKIFIAIIIVSITALGLYIFKSNIKNRVYQRIDQTQTDLEKRIDELNQRNLEKEFGPRTIFDLVSHLKTFQVFNNGREIPLIRLGREGDGGYLVSKEAITNADVLLGYGVQDDISFEEDFSKTYNKPSYGFDCGSKEIKTTTPLTHFISECIATDKFLYNSTSSMKVSSFSQQIKNLNLEDKKIFIKMDIEGSEYEALPEIISNSDNITGIVMELHLVEEVENSFNKALELVKSLNEKFYLVNIHGNNCGWETFTSKNLKGRMPRLLELSYINKNLVSKANIDPNQLHPSKADLPTCKNKNELVFETN